MIKIQVHLDEEGLEQLTAHLEYLAGSGLKGGAFPNTNKAFKVATRRIQEAWRNWAMGGELDGAQPIKNPSTNLMRSIKVDEFNDFEAEVYSEHPLMSQVQNGRKAYDLKETHPYGRKSRVTQSGPNKGVPYLIVPFRWGTPNSKGGKRAHFSNMIPTDVHNYIKNKERFSRSKRLGDTHTEKNFLGEDIERSEYIFGDRIDYDGNANGMVAFPDTNGNSTYFTFRIISAKGPEDSWKVPAIPANDVTGAIKKKFAPIVAKDIEEGAKADFN